MKTKKIFVSFSVDDSKKAKEFYSQTLGLSVSENKEMKGHLIIHLSHDNEIMVYTKPDHSPSAYTILNFVVDDVEKTVDELTGQGVRFEIYDQPGIKTDQKGISRSENGPTIAWFKDPAGNICSVLQE